MNIGVVGTGYVGLVTGSCLADAGNRVVCMDIDTARVAALKQGQIPIYEPGLTDLVQKNINADRLHFTTDIAELIASAEIIFIAVGTPCDEDGSADLKQVLAAASAIGEHMLDYRLVVTKSTVPVGAAVKVRAAIAESLNKRKLELDFDVASNPEFLKEGAAIQDFTHPDRIVIGVDSVASKNSLRQLYAPFSNNHENLIVMDIASSEMTKYAANIMLASKISTINEIANIAELLGADIEHIRAGIGADPRIGTQFIFAGAGYGGSCFPKDIRALENAADQCGYRAELLQAIEAVNQRQKEVLFNKIENHFGGSLSGFTIALWGLSFKPGTDDMREASSLVLIRKLIAAGVRIKAYDPQAMLATQQLLESSEHEIIYCEDEYAAAEGADALVLITEWQQFLLPDFSRLANLMQQKVIFDGRNIWDPVALKAMGFHYSGIGRL